MNVNSEFELFPFFDMIVIENPKLENLPIYVPESHQKIFEIGQYLTNPILPNSIAEPLSKLFRSNPVFSKVAELKGQYLLLSESQILDAKEFRDNFPPKNVELVCSNFSSYKEFSRGINELKQAIEKWLKKRSIKDLNIYWKEPRQF